MNNEMTTDNMSNEEAVEVLKGIVFNGFDRTTREERQALHRAIQALETGEIYIDGEDYNFFIRGYKEGRKDFEKPQDRWIPVSERLPQNRDWYLGIFREVDTGWINPVPYICDYVGKETIGTTKAGWILKNITDEKYCAEYYKNLECICWQPLPVKPNIPDLGGGAE